MYIQRNIVAHLCSHHCHGNVTMHSLYIAADLQSAVINTQKLNTAMKMPDWVDELQIFHTTVKNIKCQILLSKFNQIWSFPTDYHKYPQHQTSQKSNQWQPH